MKLSLLWSCACAALAPSAIALADDTPPASTTVDTVIVTAPSSIANLTDVPNTTSTVTADQIARTIEVVTPEDTLRYVPDVLIRQRHIGDTQSPITTRTSGVGDSARSLIYVDGILVSALIGNNNTSASPKWGLITPDAVERVDVLNGPFSAAFPGNSIGSVITFTTRMPSRFEADAEAQGGVQSFSKYADHADYGTARLAADIGDRLGPFAFRLSYNHLDTQAQPLTYVTAVVPSASSASGTPVAGAFSDLNRTSQPIQVLGSAGIEHQIQDNASGRLTWDLSPDVTAAYTFGLFLNNDDASVNSYLRNSAGAPVYAGQVNIGGKAYAIGASSFDSGVYRLDEAELAQGLSLSSHAGGVFDFDLTATNFDYLSSRQRAPTTALPAAFTGGAGTVAKLDGTGWSTFDADGKWRPAANQTVSFGAHYDGFRLSNPTYALTDWLDDAPTIRLDDSEGRTQTTALWAQDVWSVTPQVKLTIGGRYEWWRAFDGLNYSSSPALSVRQPTLSDSAFSPKLTAAWTPWAGWTLKGSVAIANRFPTVSELYQAVTTGPTLSTPNPDLKPEHALSSELSAERDWLDAFLRVSVFDERVHNALISQTGMLGAVAATYVQNVDLTHATGVEVVGDWRDAFVKGLELSGWITYVDARTVKDAALPAADGKELPQLPRLRASAVASYAVTPRLDLTLAARYSGRSFATIDNSDNNPNTFQGFDRFLVVDVDARYRLSRRLTADLAVTNLGDDAYFLYHPFPQRTVLLDLKYAY